MSTFTQTITDGTNSVHERDDNGNVIDNASEVDLLSGALDTYVGLRFQNTGANAIPQGSTIVSALLTVTPINANDDAAGRIFCEDVDDSAAFNIGSATFDVTSRTRTNTECFWGEFGLGVSPVNTSDFSGPMQELVNRPGFGVDSFFSVIIVPRPNEGKVLNIDPDAITITVVYEAANPASTPGVEIAVIQQAASTSLGVQTFTKAGFDTPQGYIIAGNHGLAAGTIAANASYVIGAGDRYYTWHNSTVGVDAAAASGTMKRGTVGEGIQFTPPGEASGSFNTDGKGNISLCEDGIRINWREAPSAGFLITVILFKGFSEAAAGYADITPASGGAVAIDIGFDPDIMFFSHINGAGNNFTTADIQTSSGFVTREAGVINQAGVGVYSQHAQDPSNTFGVVNEAAAALNTIGPAGTFIREASVAFVSNGVEVTRLDGQAATSSVGWLAFKLPAGVKAALQILDTHTSVATKAYTGFGFKPQTVLTLSNWQTDADGVPDAGFSSWGISAFNATEEYSVSASEQDDAATTVAKSLSSAKALSMLDVDGTLGVEATLSTLDDDGFTLDFTTVDASARKFVALAIQETGGKVPVVGPGSSPIFGSLVVR